MSSDPRDTQFSGFAALLWTDISQGLSFFDFGLSAEQQASIDTAMKKMIAERAYDLVDHTVCWIEPIDYQCHENPCEVILKTIPDLTIWPERDE